MTDLSDDELLAELGVDVEPERRCRRTPQEERILAGFEDIQRFVDAHGRFPQHGEGRDIFERLYAVRLDQIRKLPGIDALLGPIDRQGLLAAAAAHEEPEGRELDDETLLAELGIEASGESDITQLKHVKPRLQIRVAEEIANRTKCEDFQLFKPLFERVQHELDTGLRQTRPFERKAEIDEGRLFIVGGQKAYVAKKGELFAQPYGDLDCRLRVIFDNGTESDMLMRSLQRALHKDDAGRRITEPDVGPLFGAMAEDGDAESGTIYVLRSRSDHPVIAASRDLIHKIGVTGGKVSARIANARFDATYLLADVDVVATYELYNINRAKLEELLHRFFSPARLDLEIPDRFGHPVRPQEWYLAPLQAIDAAVKAIQAGTIEAMRYDPAAASVVPR